MEVGRTLLMPTKVMKEVFSCQEPLWREEREGEIYNDYDWSLKKTPVMSVHVYRYS